MENNITRAGFTIIELLVCIFGLAALAGAIAVVWVACHFIAKYWNA